MSFDKLLEGIHVKESLKLPFLQLLTVTFNHCDELQLKYKLNRLTPRITTDIDISLDSDLYGAGAHFRYERISGLCFVAEITIPKQIDSLVNLYLVAHEIGHFIKGHSNYFLEGKENPSRDPFDVEVEADEWAVQFFYDMGLERTKEIEDTICNNLSIYSKPGEKRTVNFEIK
jgi:hypothetical protein